MARVYAAACVAVKREFESQASKQHRTISQIDLSQERLTALEARGAPSDFLAEPTAELATAALIQQLESVVADASAGGRGCAIVNRTPIE